MAFMLKFQETVWGYIKVEATSPDKAHDAIAKGKYEKVVEEFEFRHDDLGGKK